MQGARQLEQTPSLVDADVADDVRNMRAAISDRQRPYRGDRNRQVQIASTVRLNTLESSRPMLADTPLPN